MIFGLGRVIEAHDMPTVRAIANAAEAGGYKVTDLILGLCEEPLTAVKKTFDDEKVPAGASDRYIRGKRSRAAQQIVRVVMAEEASRSAKSH